MGRRALGERALGGRDGGGVPQSRNWGALGPARRAGGPAGGGGGGGGAGGGGSWAAVTRRAYLDEAFLLFQKTEKQNNP